jgi:Na+/pantothenate symporter
MKRSQAALRTSNKIEFIVGAIYWKRCTAKAAITSMAVSATVTIFFLIKDGLDANSPIFFGLGSSLLVFFSFTALGDRHARDGAREPGNPLVGPK